MNRLAIAFGASRVLTLLAPSFSPGSSRCPCPPARATPDQLRAAIAKFRDAVSACEAVEDAESPEFDAAASREVAADRALAALIRAAVPRPVSPLRACSGEVTPFAVVRLDGFAYVARPGGEFVDVIDERMSLNLDSIE